MKKINPTFVVGLSLVAAMTLTMAQPSIALQAFTTFACATSTACVIGNNSSTGPGVQGIAKSNAGVFGQSTTGSGVRGQSSSTSGVVGTTSTGAQGILGQAASTVGVKGSTTSTTTAGTGVSGTSAGFGFGVLGTATKSVGVEGNGLTGVEATDVSAATRTGNILFLNGFGSAMLRANNSSGVDVLTLSNFGILNSFAITAGSANVGTGVNANGGFAGVQGSAAAATARGVQGNNTSNSGSTAVYANGFGGREFVGNGSNGVDNFIVDNSGNVFAHAFFATLSASQRTANGATIATYTHETRAPTIEDFGEASLAAGHAYVRLDPAFAGTLARGVQYYVFVTPMGATRGQLYVSQRTPTGFYVHESGVGGSTVAFDYRIVGRRLMPAAPAVVISHNAAKVLPIIPTFVSHPKTRTGLPQ